MSAEPRWVELVELARTGDQVVCAALLLRFTPLVRTTASRLVGLGDVDDVSQETFAVAIVHLVGGSRRWMWVQFVAFGH